MTFNNFSILDRAKNILNVRSSMSDIEWLLKHPILSSGKLRRKLSNKKLLDPETSVTVPEFIPFPQKIYQSEFMPSFVRENFRLIPGENGGYKISKNPDSKYTNDLKGYKLLTKDVVNSLINLNNKKKTYEKENIYRPSSKSEIISDKHADNTNTLNQASDLAWDYRNNKVANFSGQMRVDPNFFEKLTEYDPNDGLPPRYTIPEDFIGYKVAVNRPNGYAHYGVVKSPTEVVDWQIDKSRNKFGEMDHFRQVPIEVFLGENKPKDLHFYKPDKFTSDEVLNRIKDFEKTSTRKSYHPTQYNCEHVANEIVNGIPSSGQINTVSERLMPFINSLTQAKNALPEHTGNSNLAFT